MPTPLLIFSGNNHLNLSKSVCSHVGKPLGKALVSKFSDGETRIEILESVRGANVFIIQPTSAPANDSIIELLIFADALRRANAQTITAVIPFFGYGRQDRKTAQRGPISAKLMADLFQTAGIHRVLTVDLHSDAIEGFFHIPVEQLTAQSVFLDHFQKVIPDPQRAVVVSPDAGGTERARMFAKSMGCGLAVIDKRRDGPGVAAVINIIGDVKNKSVILMDDMCDTGGTLCEGASALISEGASQVYAAATHGVFTGNAISKIRQSPIQSLAITNSIATPEAVSKESKIIQFSIAELLAKAILNLHDEK